MEESNQSDVSVNSRNAGPGRPRNAVTDQAILDNTLKLLIEQGYRAMTIEAVAAASGVTKPTIYRRYPGKRDLVAAAIMSLVNTFELPVDSGNLRMDMMNYFRQVYTDSKVDIALIIGAMIVSEQEEPALMELLRQQIITPRLKMANELFQRGVDRGEIRPDISIPVVAQMLIGSLLACHVWGESENEAWLGTVIDTLLGGLWVRPEHRTGN